MKPPHPSERHYEDRFKASPAYHAMDAALCAHGWPSYEAALQERLTYPTDAIRERFHRMHCDWTERMRVAAGLPEDSRYRSQGMRSTGATPSAKGRSQGIRQHVKRGKPEEPIPPAHLAAMRARLDDLLAPGQKLGRPRKAKRPNAREADTAFAEGR